MECQLKSSSSFGSCEQTYIKQLAETAEKIEREINNTKTKIMNLMNLSLYMLQIQCNKNVTNFVFLGSKIIPEKHILGLLVLITKTTGAYAELRKI